MSHVLPGSSVVQGGSENGEIVVSELAESAAVVALPPLPDVPMIGRTEEHASVISALRNSSSRVASITGPGGVGKTHLALSVAWALVDAFPDGVVFVLLSDAMPGTIWETVARQIGVARHPGQSWHEALCAALSMRHLLLVLDGCDHAGADLVSLVEILVGCPNVRVLATSQDALGLGIEQDVRLDALPLPDDWPAPVDILRSGAVEFFVMRVTQRDPAFTIDAGNADDIAAIVRMLDGLPLALELAAEQTRYLAPAELRHQLDRSLLSLASRSRCRPERHRSLISMGTWSLGLLSDEERRRFLRLPVLEGDFTPEIAFQTMDVSDIEGWALLTSFADKSLVTRVIPDRQTSPEAPRFFMLKPLRAVGQYLLEQNPEESTTARLNQGAAFLSVARDAARQWHGPDEPAALRALDDDAASIRSIIENAVNEPRLHSVALELADPMCWYWCIRNEEARILPHLERILTSVGEGDADETRGIAHVAAGWLALRLQQSHRAASHFGEGARLIPNATHPAALRGRIGTAYLDTFTKHEFEKVNAILQEVIDLAQQRPACWYELATGYFSMGRHLYVAGRISEARTYLKESLSIVRAYRDHQGVAMNLLCLAQIDGADTNGAEVIRKVHEAIALLQDGGDRPTILFGIDIAIMAIARLGDATCARELAIASERIRLDLHIPRSPEEQATMTDTLHGLLVAADPGAVTTSGSTPPLAALVQRILSWRPPVEPAAAASAVSRTLSRRELEVLRLVADGKTAPQIAEELFVSPHTVKRHKANIRRKLGVRSQAAAVAMLQCER